MKNLSRNTILVVEDFDLIIRGVADVLLSHGFIPEPESVTKKFTMTKDNTDVVFTPTGEIAENALEEGLPNLKDVFLDWDLGNGKSGVDLFLPIYNHTNQPAIHITSSTPLPMKQSIYRTHGIGTPQQKTSMDLLFAATAMDMVNAVRPKVEEEPEMMIDRTDIVEKRDVAKTIAALAQAYETDAVAAIRVSNTPQVA